MANQKGNLIRSSIVTAFTIAVALIWKDVFTEAVNRFIPPAEHLTAQFVSAIIATALIILALKLFLSGEEKAEKVIEEMEHMFDDHGNRDKHRNGHQHSEHS